MAITLHAPDRQAPAMPAPLPSLHAIKRAHSPRGPRPAPSAAMKRLALVIACAAVYFAFSATFEPARSHARTSAEAQGSVAAQQARPLPSITVHPHQGDPRAATARGDHAP